METKQPHKKFKVDWFGGVYIPIYPRRYAPVHKQGHEKQIQLQIIWYIEQMSFSMFL